MSRAVGAGRRAFTLVELMVVIVIVGILAMLAIYGVRKYLATSKTIEARNMIGQITHDAQTAFERESGGSTVLPSSGSAAIVRQLCASSSAIPTSPPSASKYQSRITDWSSDPGWKCLKFSIDQPQYFNYQYIASNTTSAAGAFAITANGDLNGNGVLSTFQMNGKVQSGIINTSPSLAEVNPEE